MEHDSSDILGQPTMPATLANRRGWFPLSLSQAVWTSFLILGVYLTGKRLWRRVLLWRERSYRLATRRRHGIPDSDLRPFNVAYSEAQMRARDQESRLPKPKPALIPQASSSIDQQRQAKLEQNLRYRTGQSVPQRPDLGMRSSVLPVPGGYITSLYEPRLPSQTRNPSTADSYHPRQPARPPSHGFSKPALVRHGGYLDITDADNGSDGEGRKRALDEEQDEEHEAKKTRVEGDELIDGDEDAEFEDQVPKRGSKRVMQDEEDYDDVDAAETKKARGKRARKVSQEKRPQADQNMDVDDEEEADQITELKASSRGKKRDRAEAGSTFGGDEEEDESFAEDEFDGDAKARRRRKRRTVAKRKSEASFVRGRNGHHDADFSDSEGEENDAKFHKKNGKPRRVAQSDISMDESTSSTRSKIRNIGDEWESNGVKYKIGINGQRLRQALVKKARQKFVMPQDSVHPDRDASLQICVETWLTEGEFQDAKAQHMLAWQDPKPSEETQRLSLNTADAMPQPQAPTAGKNLLWSTSTTTTPTMSPMSLSPPRGDVETPKHRNFRDGYRHSLVTSAGLPIDPFAQEQQQAAPSIKRIASNARGNGLNVGLGGPPGLSDSTNSLGVGSPRTPHTHRVYSKWEKQELEAKAMMKIREATRKKEMEREREAKERAEKEQREAVERQRVERERLEKERMEMERQKKEREEKAEAERKRAADAAAAAEKAKVAAAAAAPPPMVAPQITVTAPSQSSIGSTPSFFGNGASAAAPAAPKVEQRTPSGGFNPFGPSNGAAAAAAAPSTQPTTAPTFGGFGGSGGTSTTPASKTGGFSFGAPTSGEPKKEGDGNGSTLLSRLGQDAGKTPAQNQSQTSAPTPSFSFAKPEGGGAASNTNGTPSNPFGAPVNGTSSNPFGAPANGTASSNPFGAPANGTSTGTKFNFNVKPAAPGAPSGAGGVKAPVSAFPSTAANGTSSSLSGALGSAPGGNAGGTEQKTSFSFKTPAAPASGSGVGTTGGLLFGAPLSGNSARFGGNPTSTAMFGASSAPAPASAFGNTSTTSAFGKASTLSAFGTTNTVGQGAAPSPFGAPSGGNTSSSSPKPLFSFAPTTTPTPTPAPAATTTAGPAFSFKFGQSGSTTTPFGGGAK